jgi:hypothetical protein
MISSITSVTSLWTLALFGQPADRTVLLEHRLELSTRPSRCRSEKCVLITVDRVTERPEHPVDIDDGNVAFALDHKQIATLEYDALFTDPDVLHT